MKWIVIFGIVTSIINAIINYNNDPAFWGWLSSTAWASALFLTELTQDK